MSPPLRAPPLTESALLERLLDKMDRLETEVSSLKQMLAERLTVVERDAAQIRVIEMRVRALEDTKARAEGAMWLGRIVAMVLGGAVEWAATTFLHH